jgi:hypothetical protein
MHGTEANANASGGGDVGACNRTVHTGGDELHSAQARPDSTTSSVSSFCHMSQSALCADEALCSHYHA